MVQNGKKYRNGWKKLESAILQKQYLLMDALESHLIKKLQSDTYI